MINTHWTQYLDAVLRKKFDEAQIARRRPTFGIEHEFFVCNQSGALCNGEESQKIFELIATRSKSKVLHSQAGKLIQINFEHSESKSYSALKYEFYPHMLELAVGYSTHYQLLADRISDLLCLIFGAIEELGFNVPKNPLQPIGHLSDESLRSFDPKRQQLYDRRLRETAARHKNPIIANFPAFTAGTQVQIGGIAWWETEGLIGRLYSSELTVLKQTFDSMGLPPEITSSLMKERFSRYYQVYESKKLLWFPPFDQWTLTQWSNALSSDLALPPLDSASEIQTLAGKSHDLSLIAIKPFMATLEFRGAPSLPGIPEILAELSRRIEQFKIAENSSGNPSLKPYYRQWRLDTETAPSGPVLSEDPYVE